MSRGPVAFACRIPVSFTAAELVNLIASRTFVGVGTTNVRQASSAGAEAGVVAPRSS